MGNKAAELSWTLGLEGLRPPSSAFPLSRTPHKTDQEPLGIFPNRCLTTTRAKKKPQLNRREEKRKRTIRWPPLWECCKLCFPEAWESHTRAGTCGHGKRAWTASPERGHVRCRTTSLDHLVWGRLTLTHSLFSAAGGPLDPKT